MKIQELAIIFIIIILPISLLLSEYTQFQIKTINLQTEYDAKLTAATYDAIKAFQLNSTNSTTSSLTNSKMRDIEASVNSFRNSIMAGFALNGYTEEALDNYIPALVYTLYDGFYIYSPYTNIVDENGAIKAKNQQETLYGLKPYITYSCRYKKGSSDVVITYALDNRITIQGQTSEGYINKSGYLIDNIVISDDDLTYNGVLIEKEQLKEYINITNENGTDISGEYAYAKISGTKYYLIPGYSKDGENCIVYILNGTPIIQYRTGDTQYISWKYMIENNDNARRYYEEAMDFTEWLKNESGLVNLTYGDAYDVDGSTKIWEGDTTTIFKDSSNNIENELSNFNQHRLAVIRHTIETNLAVAISNYNKYSKADNVFQMPELKEDEWEHITHNISLISFLQGLPIGGKIYNGYSLVTNSESKEVVLEDYIYILGSDNNYHKIGDTGLESGAGSNKIEVSAGTYVGDANGDGNLEDDKVASAGRLNLDFEKNLIINSNSTSLSYYYPLKNYNASYDSVVMQNKVTTYDDIYAYVNGSGNDDLKKAFYTALGRERYSIYKSDNTTVEYYSVLVIGSISPGTSSSPEAYKKKIREIINELSEEKEIKATYVFSKDNSKQENGLNVLENCLKNEMKNYNLIIVHSFVWTSLVGSDLINEAANNTNIITIGNDVNELAIMEGKGKDKTTVTPIETPKGKEKLGNIAINTSGKYDNQAAFKFKDGVDIFYTGTYTEGEGGKISQGEYDLIGCLERGNYRWIHSQVSLDNVNNAGHKKLLKELVKYALKID